MDITSLLAPIKPAAPCGIDLSFSPEVDAIQEMRREDDPSLEQGAWVVALKSADWPGVARRCEAILATQSKDLRIAGWLADAWARLRGFDGLADGLDLAAALVDGFWDPLHPLLEDGDPEPRIGNLRWLSARIDQLVPTIPLVSHEGRETSLSDINAARARRLAGPAAANGNGGAPASALEAVWSDVAASGREAARSRRAQVARARAALVTLQAGVDEKMGDEAPSFVAPRTALGKALDELEQLERECGFLENLADESQPMQWTGSADPGSGPTTPSASNTKDGHQERTPDRIETRAQALEQLRQVARFFRITEPHSPVAYLADKAVRWSEMPLHEWLRAVVKDGGSLAHLEDMLGVEPLVRT